MASSLPSSNVSSPTPDGVLASVVPLVWLLQQLVIKREEAYLEEKFGEPYLEYKNKVRRWL